MLLSKLPAYGKSGNEQAWFKNYPSRPFQYAHYENDKSELQPVAIVAPQGPILGPLLFLNQINDLSKKVRLLLHGTLERFCMEPVRVGTDRFPMYTISWNRSVQNCSFQSIHA